MGSEADQPVVSILIAFAACLVLVALGLDLGLSVGIFIVWVGSVYLAHSRPPTPPVQTNDAAISTESMGKLIKHSASPLMVIESGKVSRASRSAKKLLGKHILGQDARMTLRQPEAVKLLSKKKSGIAIVRGLARRRDIWRMKLQVLGDEISVIELTNLTSEADISRAHTDFVANASHELRTPLASIIGYVETLSDPESTVDKKTSEKFLGTILRESRRLQSLVSDLMSLSRIEAEKHEEPTEIIDFAELIKRSACDAAGDERSGRLELNLDYSLRIKGDPQQIEQLVRNVTDNALKYSHKDKTVRLELAQGREGQARFTVEDQGDGIESHHLPHLTRRFYRTDPGRSRAAGGTGLGLAIVKHIVERHRGRLDIESQLGKGTRVIVRIPTASGEAR